MPLIIVSLLIHLSSCRNSSSDQTDRLTTAAPAKTTSNSESNITENRPPASTSNPISSEAEHQPGAFQAAINRASSAVAIGQSAQSSSDWQLAVSRWQQAIQLMQQVPLSSSQYLLAQSKIEEYQQHLAAAQSAAVEGQSHSRKALSQNGQSDQALSRPSGSIAQIPILRRRGGTPVVPVTLKAQGAPQEFDMLFDTGATGTLITPTMAQALGVTPIGQARVTIADGSQVNMPVGYLEYVELGDFRRDKLLVAIGGEVALLGQNAYGDFGISIGSYLINLYR